MHFSLQIKKIYVCENDNIGEDENILEFYEDDDSDVRA